jgi:hypothetical protein
MQSKVTTKTRVRGRRLQINVRKTVNTLQPVFEFSLPAVDGSFSTADCLSP